MRSQSIQYYYKTWIAKKVIYYNWKHGTGGKATITMIQKEYKGKVEFFPSIPQFFRSQARGEIVIIEKNFFSSIFLKIDWFYFSLKEKPFRVSLLSKIESFFLWKIYANFMFFSAVELDEKLLLCLNGNWKVWKVFFWSNGRGNFVASCIEAIFECACRKTSKAFFVKPEIQ